MMSLTSTWSLVWDAPRIKSGPSPRPVDGHLFARPLTPERVEDATDHRLAARTGHVFAAGAHPHCLDSQGWDRIHDQSGEIAARTWPDIGQERIHPDRWTRCG